MALVSSLQSWSVPVVAGPSRGREGRDVVGQLPAHAFLTSITPRFAPEQQGFAWLRANKTQPHHLLFVKYKAEIFPFFLSLF